MGITILISQLFKMRKFWATDRIYIESYAMTLLTVDNVAPIEDKGWLDHPIMNLLIIQVPVEVPLCEEGDGMTPLCSFVWIIAIMG